MTDTELKRRKAICDIAGVKEIDDVSDGFHTFRQLYYQRMILFATIVKQNKDKAWKSLRHEDGEYCFGGGWFIVGIDTPEGSYTYHYENKYWDMFDCIDLPRAKHWDGHTDADAETRLMSLTPERKQGECMRLIDADELLQRIQHEELQMAIHGREFSTCFNSPGGTPSTEWWYVEDLIENAPTIEPKKGKWIDKSGGIEGAWNYCSICGEQAIDLYDFCPNCGADMREGASE